MKILILLLFTSSLAIAQTKDSVYNYLVEIGCKHPEIVTAQAILETGHFKSYSAKTRKNLFGLWNHAKQEFYTFDNWRESCKGYINKVQYKYESGNYFVFLQSIGYATDPNYITKLKKCIN